MEVMILNYWIQYFIHKVVKELLLKWLAMRLIRQYHVDVCAGLYAWSYEFVGKNKE